ncbi:MAG: glycine cleavage system protein GcvH [Candidatus Thermoplasmatota archaeon]|nr:glycine cleavage system protein GcvH [Candidatus Thermoplasmatota archaeon]MEC9333244.1 glycine cleavage system protein GcvH [Candidatus Thermoplasmatota archaeon]MED6305722.1 glycine cleavage system protein GcvH [Candidatus Thermoplasmatota archaeon]MEE3242524.1 glycine cleavage system protein GcvH [Candidatus Thermoplasmatota archaeon]
MSLIPDGLSYTKEHEWLEVQEDGKARTGITDYAQDALSDVVFVELPEVGAEFAKGEVMAVAESVKAASDIYAPISGKIISINEKLEESPELVNESPYEFGWMVLIEPQGEIRGLLDAESYRESID